MLRGRGKRRAFGAKILQMLDKLVEPSPAQLRRQTHPRRRGGLGRGAAEAGDGKAVEEDHLAPAADVQQSDGEAMIGPARRRAAPGGGGLFLEDPRRRCVPEHRQRHQPRRRTAQQRVGRDQHIAIGQPPDGVREHRRAPPAAWRGNPHLAQRGRQFERRQFGRGVIVKARPDQPHPVLGHQIGIGVGVGIDRTGVVRIGLQRRHRPDRLERQHDNAARLEPLLDQRPGRRDIGDSRDHGAAQRDILAIGGQPDAGRHPDFGGPGCAGVQPHLQAFDDAGREGPAEKGEAPVAMALLGVQGLLGQGPAGDEVQPPRVWIADPGGEARRDLDGALAREPAQVPDFGHHLILRTIA